MKQATVKADVGVAGLGVMGANLACNIEGRGNRVAVWSVASGELDAFMKAEAGRRFVPAATDAAFVSSLERPRIVLLMITAGAPVDLALERFAPLLEPGDIIIDGGNSWYEDTRRREGLLEQKGIHFVGMGVSGGAEGARNGPSLMPGGSARAYQRISPLLESIAAWTDAGPCVTHVGEDGAGHFVKMVHNGIEYADMQLIAEAYDLLKRAGGRDAAALQRIFTEWSEGPLASFLMELTGRLFSVPDKETGLPLVEMIRDQARQKGTGQWTVAAAHRLGVAVPTIAAAVDARLLSAMKQARVEASRLHGAASDAPPARPHDAGLEGPLHQALLASKIIAHAQGFSLIRCAASEHGWRIDLREIARIWRGGCVIRSALLDTIMAAFADQPCLDSILLGEAFRPTLQESVPGLRRTVAKGIEHRIPLPAFSAALGYFDALTTPQLPQNLIQAQRDAFGAHRYQRVDDPNGDTVHTDWGPWIRTGR